MTVLPNRVVTEIPMHFRRHGGKTVVIHPDGGRVVEHSLARTDQTLIKVIARAFRWERLLMSGRFNSIDELAASEGINPSYVSRVMRISLLSPDIIEAILDGRHPAHLTMKDLLEPFPLDWTEQWHEFGFIRRTRFRV